MCGICGAVLSPEAFDVEGIVRQMNAALVHRGPDDSGQWDSGEVSVAMRRLSIIDLAGGHQPIFNEDASRLIVMNGEIYNYRELREELIGRGHRFRTRSDTEVVLHLFEEHGEQTPRYLQGMFVFCVVDTRDRSLFLARDRFGEKPLFYWQDAGHLAFSSELASLLECPAVPRALCAEALPHYLQQRLVPCPLTMFRDVHQLPPGHSLRWSEGQADIRPYFHYRACPDDSLDERSAADMVRTALCAAVRRQRISDVPVGAFLSGGIDSSTVVAALQRESTKKIPTFTARFENAAYDESPIARKVAEHLGTDHHEFVIPSRGFDEEDLLRVIRHAGQPFADSSAIPTYYISRQIRDAVTVCLSGDGGDEMFAGYTYFRDCLKVDELASWAPRAVFRGIGRLGRLAGRLPGLKHASRLRQVVQAADLASRPYGDRFLGMAPLFDRFELRKLLQHPQGNGSGQADDPFGPYRDPAGFPTRLRQLMALRVGFHLSEDMLVKVDRMSMATSLEVRAPMLDVAVSEVAARMPDRLLIRDGITKFILREAARPWLPDEVFSHPKWGFSIPLHDYQNEAYRRMCHDLVLSDTSLTCRLFSRRYLHRIVQRGLTRRRDAADVSVFRATHQVWALLQLAAWADHFGVTL